MSLTKAREFAVLSVLRSHTTHGYAISKALSQGPFRLLGLSRASIYAILERFRKRNWTTATKVDGDAYPDKEILSLTQTAPAQDEQLATLGDLDMSTTPLMALALVADSGTDIPPQILDRLISVREQELDNWAQDREHQGTQTMRFATDILQAELQLLRRLQGISG